MSYCGKTISCIIPAWNEGGRVGEVLKNVVTYPHFDEVIVIDDGSDDNTYDEAIEFSSEKVQIIRHEENRGKAAAVLAGVANSTGEIIFMLDADLVGITHSDIDELLLPHKKGECMTMACMSNMFIFQRVTGLSTWSGTRTVPRRLFDSFDDKGDRGYAVESHINAVALKEKLPILSLPWRNVEHVSKYEKIGVRDGMKADMAMFKNIFEHCSISESTWQLVRILILKNYYNLVWKI